MAGGAIAIHAGYAAFEDGALAVGTRGEAAGGMREMDRFRAWEMSNRPRIPTATFHGGHIWQGDVIDARQHGRW